MCMYALVYSTVVECHDVMPATAVAIGTVTYHMMCILVLYQPFRINASRANPIKYEIFVPLYFPKTSKKIPCCNYVYNHECVGQ